MWFRTQLEPDTEFWQNLIYCHTVKFIIAAVILTALHKKIDAKKKVKRKEIDPTELRPVTTKNNPHPFLFHDVLVEILSRVDIITVYKCRAVNSEWAEVGAREINQRLPIMESEVQNWKEIPYRPTDEEIKASTADEDDYDTQLRYFRFARPSLFKSYTVDYPAAYHIQDLVVSADLGKKIIDPKAITSLTNLYSVKNIMSPQFPFLLKLEFNYENHQLIFKEAQKLGLTFKLTPETLPKNLLKMNGCRYEGLFNMASGKAYNIRLLKEPKLAFGIIPIDKNNQNVIPLLFGLSAFIADNWTFFPHLFDILLVLFSGYTLSILLKREYQKISVLIVLEIVILLIFNFSMLFDTLRLFVIICIGYNITSFLIRARQVLPTTELGRIIIGVALVLDLIYMNVNLKLFITNIMNGDILWTLWYYARVFGVGALHVFGCMWMYPNGQIRQQVTKGFWIRVIIMILIYVFYNPN